VDKSNTSHTNSEHQAMADEHVSPGFLILSSSLKLLFRDEQSWKLCGLINKIEQGKAATGVIPHAVLQICAQVAQMLKSAPNSKDLDDLQVKHLISDGHTQILVLAIGLPDVKDHTRSEILVLLEEVSRPLEPLLRSAKRRFQLTEREVNVVQHLLKGMTNKEIANEMGVTRTAILLAISGVITPAS